MKFAKLLTVAFVAGMLMMSGLPAFAQTDAPAPAPKKAKIHHKAKAKKAMAAPMAPGMQSSGCVDQFKSCMEGCAGIKAGKKKEMTECKQMCDQLRSACK